MKQLNLFSRLFFLIINNLRSKFLILLLIPLFFSCLKPDDYDFEKIAGSYDGEWAIPLIRSRLTIYDLLNDSNSIITADANNFITLSYVTDELYSITAEELIDIPDQTFINEDTIIYPPLPPGVSDSIVIIKPFSFSTDTTNQRLDSVFIKSVNMEITLSSDINHSFQVEVRIPALTKNGQGFILTLPHNYTGSLPVTASQNVPLDGYILTLDNTPGNTNKLVITYVLYLTGDNDPINNPYQIDLTVNMSDHQFSKLFGYLGQYVFPSLSDSINLEVFTSTIKGTIKIHELKTYINTHNAFGMPINIEIENFTTLSSTSPLPVHILPVGTQIPMPSPTIAQLGQYIDTTYMFDENNSGIVNAINSLPSSILYKVKGISNPANNPSVLNFVLDSSKFSVDAKIEIPFHVAISGFVLEDTLNFKFSNVDEIESAIFTVITDNGFPVSAEVQIYFVNDGYFVLDSLFNANNNIIEAGTVGPAPDLKVISPAHKKVDIAIGRTKLDNLADATKMIIRGTVSTYQSGDVKFYSTDYIDIRVGVKTKFKANF